MSKKIKILHVSDMHFRHNGRLYYSTTRKLNNGFILNGCNVLHISDRDITNEKKNIFELELDDNFVTWAVSNDGYLFVSDKNRNVIVYKLSTD